MSCPPYVKRMKQGMMRRVAWAAWAILGMSAAAACGATDETDIQDLPPLGRPSPEARAGLPEVAGTWNFAGWELAVNDTAAVLAELSEPGDFRIETQRLDSLAGVYVTGAEQSSFVGEVRRDSVVALVVSDGTGRGRFVAGEIHGDTFWMELTSLAVAGPWPPGTRGVFLRDSVRTPFVRLPGGVLLETEPDTLAL